MVNKDYINNKEFDKIEELTRNAVRTMLGFELKHIGVNMDDEGAADETACTFEKLFGFEKKVGNSSIFAGTGIEVMKSVGRGTKGHLAIATNFVDRAVYQLEKNGFEFDLSTAKYDAKGNMTVVYMEGEVGGFAIHLVQK